MKEIILTLNEAQVIELSNSQSIREHQTPEELCDYVEAELEELREELRKMREGTADYHDVASEVADVGILFFALCNSLGLQADVIVTAKMKRNHTKYNRVQIVELIEQGFHPLDAWKMMKTRWDKKRDRDFK